MYLLAHVVAILVDQLFYIVRRLVAQSACDQLLKWLIKILILTQVLNHVVVPIFERRVLSFVDIELAARFSGILRYRIGCMLCHALLWVIRLFVHRALHRVRNRRDHLIVYWLKLACKKLTFVEDFHGSSTN